MMWRGESKPGNAVRKPRQSIDCDLIGRTARLNAVPKSKNNLQMSAKCKNPNTNSWGRLEGNCGWTENRPRRGQSAESPIQQQFTSPLEAMGHHMSDLPNKEAVQGRRDSPGSTKEYPACSVTLSDRSDDFLQKGPFDTGLVIREHVLTHITRVCES